MGIRKKTSAYDKLAKKLGEVTFANHLRAVAETDFETRTACAKKLGMSPQSLNDYMSGKRIPTPNLAAQMAQKLGYSPLSFIELALSDTVKKAGYKYNVNLEST
ncbi:MAG: helix-turn-helix transcriptional regulator [Bacteriovoracales bacterium]|nr:helix-turn-helix transcriptional regulator [Bacteriovoracales bacterium]